MRALIISTAIAILAIAGVEAYMLKADTYTLAEKQKFLLEIVYRVEDPLAFEEWVKLGKSFMFDYGSYLRFDREMKSIYDNYLHGTLLPKGKFFGALIHQHLREAQVLFKFFYQAIDWHMFQRIVAWARIHFNEGVFVNALTLAVARRYDCQHLMLPSINEIFPQHFFNSQLAHEAEKFDYNLWSKYSMYEKEFKKLLYDDYFTLCMSNNNDYNCNMTDFKLWQWYKMMDLDKRWYSEDDCVLRNNIYDYCKNPIYKRILQGTKMFFLPVNNTRDVKSFNKESSLPYFTADVGLNVYWYNLNMDYSFLLEENIFDLNSEYWMYKVRQLLSRYYLERLSHGYGEIPEFSYSNATEYGYHPRLRTEDYKFDYYHKFATFSKRLDEHINEGVYANWEGRNIDLRKPKSGKYNNVTQRDIDNLSRHFLSFWYVFVDNYFTDAYIRGYEVLPNIVFNYETMMSDPLFYTFYKKISSVYHQFASNIKPYTPEKLLFPGVTIKDVKVSELVTYFDLVDFDVTNLSNEKMTFVDGKFVWDKTLLARQIRLNHKPFEFEFTIDSKYNGNVVVRTYLAPKYDQNGRVIALNKNRENFLEIDSFIYVLRPGVNTIKRRSKDFCSTARDRITYSELYKYVMLAVKGVYQFPLDMSRHSCGFPDNLILPRGWHEGMPVQLFFYVTKYYQTYESIEAYENLYSCDIRSGKRYINDGNPFGFPFNREINENKFIVPNMYFKDVKIFHKDAFDKYYEK